MTKRLLTLVLIVQAVLLTAAAQSKTILISESALPYAEQTWYAYGTNGKIDQNDITAGWAQGKHLVAAAYTDEGWLTVLAKHSGFSRQTFSISAEWPEQWIAQKTSEGYSITTMSRSPEEWLVVMSQGSGIVRQAIWRESWDNLAPWITQQKQQGYCITQLAFDGTAWTVVMSQGSRYASQGYFWVSSTQELMDRVQRDVWGRGYNVHLVEAGAGSYVVVYGNYAADDNRFQNLQVNPDSARDYIRWQWARGISIAYVGGGLPDATVKPVKESWISR